MKWIDIKYKQPEFMESVLVAYYSDTGGRRVSVAWNEHEAHEDPSYYCPETRSVVEPTHWIPFPEHPFA